MGLHFPKDPRQGGEQGVDAAEEAVVRSVLAGVLPQPFGGGSIPASRVAIDVLPANAGWT